MGGVHFADTSRGFNLRGSAQLGDFVHALGGVVPTRSQVVSGVAVQRMRERRTRDIVAVRFGRGTFSAPMAAATRCVIRPRPAEDLSLDHVAD